MFSLKIKRLVATILVVAMVLSSTSFSVFADSVDNYASSAASNEEVKNYFDYEKTTTVEEPKEDETTTVEEPEEDETTTTIAEQEEDETTTTEVEKEENETTTTVASSDDSSEGANDNADTNDNESESDKVGASDPAGASDSVGASSASPVAEEETATDSDAVNNNITESETDDADDSVTASSSDANELNDNETNNVGIATSSKVSEASETLLDNNLSTKSDVDFTLSTMSVVDNNLLGGGLFGADEHTVYYYFEDAGNTILHLTNNDGGGAYGRFNRMRYWTFTDGIVKVVIDDEIKPLKCEDWFYEAERLATISNINYINIASVSNVSGMFAHCTSLTSLDLSSFDTSNVTDMGYMFYGCSNLTNLNLSSFNTGNVTNFGDMFSGCSSLMDLDLSGFNTNNVTTMYEMFNECRSLTSLDLSSFNTSKVTRMTRIFVGCSNLNKIYVSSNFIVPSETNMFDGCTRLVGEKGTTLASVSYVHNSTVARLDGGTNHPGLFSKNSYFVYNNVLTPAWSDLYGFDKTSINRIIISKYPNAAPNVYDNKWDLTWTNNLEVYKVASDLIIYNKNDELIECSYNVSSLFGRLTNVIEISCIELLDTRNVTNMDSMFSGCSSLTSLDLSSFDTRNATVMGFMFSGCSSLNSIIASQSFVTSQVSNSGGMFRDCFNLVGGNGTTLASVSNITDKTYARLDRGVYLPGLFSNRGDTAMYSEFKNTWFDNLVGVAKSEIATISFSVFPEMNPTVYDNVWDVVSEGLKIYKVNNEIIIYGVTGALVANNNLTGAFEGFTNLVNIEHLELLNTIDVTSMNSLFENCSSIEKINLRNINTINVIDMQNMFNGCSELKEIKANSTFATSQVLLSDNMFAGCSKLVGGKGTTLADVSNLDDKTYAKIDGGIKAPGLLSEHYYVLNSTWKNKVPIYAGSRYVTIKRYPDLVPNYYSEIDWAEGNGLKMYWNYSSSSGGSSGSIIIYIPDQYSKLYTYQDLNTLFSGYNYSGQDLLTSIAPLSKNWFNVCTGVNKSDITKIILKASESAPTTYDNRWEVAGNLVVYMTGSEMIIYNTTDNLIIAAEDASGLFSDFTNLIFIENLDLLDTSNVTNMQNMFFRCNNLSTLDLSSFNTSNVTNMAGMFAGYTVRYLHRYRVYTFDDMALTSIVGLDSFDTSKVTNMGRMFAGCNNLTNIDVSSFNTSNVTDMYYMFAGCSSLTNIDVSNFDTSKVTDMSFMFYECNNLTSLDLSSFNTSNVTNMNSMFAAYYWYEHDWTNIEVRNHEMKLTSIDLSSFDTSNVTNMGHMFMGCKHMTSIDLSNFNTSKVTNMEYMFAACNKLTNINVSSFDTSKVQTFGYMFSTNPMWDTSDGSYKASSSDLVSLDISNFDTTALLTTEHMFSGNDNLKNLNLGSFDCNKLFSMEGMFACCESIETINMHNFTSMTTWSSYSFSGACPKTLAHMTSDGYKKLAAMFYNCKSLKTLDISNFNTAYSRNMAYMFYDCESIQDINLKNFKTNNVTNMYAMFRYDKNLKKLDLTSFESTNLTECSSMFDTCLELKKIYVSDTFDLTGCTGTDMFKDCYSLVGETNTGYNDSHIDSSYATIDRTGNPGYFSTAPTVTNNALNNNWYDTAGSGVMKDYIETITFESYPTSTPTNPDARWTKTSCTGLEFYRVGSDVMIYNTLSGTIKGAENLSDLFGGFTNVREIRNIDLLNTSDTTDMSYMFYNCRNLTSLDLSSFNTASVSNMQGMFAGLTSERRFQFNVINIATMSLTNLNISSFDTSKVTDMSFMFAGCTNLPSIDVSGFNTSNVTDMQYMFYECKGLTRLDLDNFDTRNVTNMGSMFGAYWWYEHDWTTIEVQLHTMNLATISVSSFDTSNVTDMSHMFSGCKYLPALDLAHFDTSNVLNMEYMFAGCNSLTSLNLHGWNTQNVETMAYMFSTNIIWQVSDGSWQLNGDHSLKSLDLSSFDLRNVQSTAHMFSGMNNLETLTLSNNFTGPKVWQMNSMFARCEKLKSLDLSHFTAAATYPTNTITRCKSLNFRLFALDVDRPKQMTCMFYRCHELKTLDISVLNTTGATDMAYTFYWCNSLNPLDVSSFDTSAVTGMYEMFWSCESLKQLDLTNFNTSNVREMHYMFQNCNHMTDINVTSFDVRNVVNMDSMFSGCRSLKELDLHSFVTTNCVYMQDMLSGCSTLKELDLSSFVTASVSNMKGMFWDDYGLTDIDVSSFDTSNVTDMHHMFWNCNSLPSLDLSSFDTRKVQDMSYMFQNCWRLVFADVSSFRLDSTTNLDCFFSGCTSLQFVDLSNMNTSHLTSMHDLFSGCSNLKYIDLYNFETNLVTNMTGMFYFCYQLKKVYASNRFNNSHVLDNKALFFKCMKIEGGNGTKYRELYEWDRGDDGTDGMYARLDEGPTSARPGYFTDGHAPTITGIRVTKEPKKLKYAAGQHFDPRDLEIEVAYSDLSTESVAYNMSQTGTFTFEKKLTETLDTSDTFVTIKYHGASCTQPITVMNLTSISIKHPPVTDYTEEDKLDVTELEITLHYTDSTTDDVAYISSAQDLWSFNPSLDASLVHTDSNLAITYCGHTVNQPITVREINNIVVKIPPRKVKYHSGEKFEPDGLVITLNYTDATTKDITYNWETSSKFSFTPDTNTKLTTANTNVSITYNSKTCNQPINVIAIYFYFEDVGNTILHLTGINAGGYREFISTSDWESMSSYLIQKIVIDDEIHPNHCINWFRNCYNLERFENLSRIKTDNAFSLEGMFSGDSSITTIDVSSFDTSSVQYFNSMFELCSRVEVIDVSSFDTRNALNMYGMFYGCSEIKNLDLSHFDTSHVTNMAQMFNSCRKLTSLDLSSFNTSCVTDMNSMFSVCDGLTSLDLSNFDTRNVTKMQQMFYYAEKITNLDLNSFDTSNVTDLSWMFYSMPALKKLDIRSFKTDNVQSMEGMFFGNSSLKTILASTSFVTNNVNTSYSMFDRCDVLRGQRGTTLASTSNVIDKTYACIDRGNAGMGYFSDVPPTLEGISVSTPPKKVTYLVGDKFDPTGLVLGLEYSDTSTDDLAYNDTTKTDFTFDPVLDTKLKSTTSEITIIYGSKQTKQSITVNLANPNPPSPTPGPKATPKNQGHGPSGGGGGGGVGRGSGVVERTVSYVLHTPIYENEYKFILDDKGNKVELYIDINSKVAKAFINSSDTKDYYQLVENGYIKIKNGLVNLYYMGREYYFGFDSFGNIMTGFVLTTSLTKYLTINLDGTITKTYETESGKYYLFETEGIYRGILWSEPIVLGGVLYMFDSKGKVITTQDVNTGKGIWEYVPTLNKWKYFEPGLDGKANYYKGGVYDISYNGKVFKYVFDEDGIMLVGNFTHNGVAYTTYDSGTFTGAIIDS